ncbi:MAG TPA: DUF58 domain-containing protein [Gemmatales bacterium]|nr:DUF58 domain-containing protein [Gemmatales bacterium]HMP60113.1 DUF58 domain-containing protein [Gemmatales bacterium]
MQPTPPRVAWARRVIDFLSHDWVPQYDRFVIDWMKTPLGLLVLALLFALFCGWGLHPHGYWVAAALAVVIAVGLVWPWLALRGLRGRLEFTSERGREGEPVGVRLQLENRWPWAAWGVGLKLDLPHEPGVDAAVSHVGGWRRRECRFDFVPPQRGVYPRVSTRLTCGFPFGLWQFSRDLGRTEPLIVWPRTFPVGTLPEAAGASHDEGLVFRNTPGTAGDILGVRPFREGDSLRWIHWAQSARHDRLIVCERQTPALPVIQLILASHASEHTPGPQGSREWAARVAASLATAWLKQGARMELAAGKVRVVGDGGQRQAQRIMDALARFEPGHDLPLAELFEQPLVRRFRGTLQVLITTDAALAAMPEHFAAQRLFAIVLRHRAFGGAAVPRFHACHSTQWLVVDDLSQLLTTFRQTWRGGGHGCG